MLNGCSLNLVPRTADVLVKFSGFSDDREFWPSERWNGATVVLTDLGSKNGTFVNGVRVSGSVSPVDGDEVRLGLVTFVYRAPASPGLSATKTVV